MRFALCVEYDGGSFHGWQRQLDKVSVQEALEVALTQIAGENISVICAGRTDAGVHALSQIVHFDTEVTRPLEAWVRGVNTFLPTSIAVRWVCPVPEEFHARFSARARHYRYLLLSRPQRPGVIHGRVGWTHHPLDLLAMDVAIKALLGQHDFSAFRAAACQAKTPVKTMHEARVCQHGDLFVFDFIANAFLHHMVRNLVGALVYVGQGNHPPEWIKMLLSMKDRSLSAPTFSPSGLYLAGVDYETKWNLPKSEDSLLTGFSALF